MPILLFADTETTGLDARVHTPWEVSWIVADHDTPTGTLRALDTFTGQVALRPTERDAADPEALKIGRWDERRAPAQDLWFPSDIVALLRGQLRHVGCETSRDVHLVGACPWFDDEMMGRWWGGTMNRPWHYHLVDIEPLLAAAAQSAPLPPPWKYSDLLAHHGIAENPARKHTAEGDTDVVFQAYAAVYGLKTQVGAFKRTGPLP